jgi:hypothetical protein
MTMTLPAPSHHPEEEKVETSGQQGGLFPALGTGDSQHRPAPPSRFPLRLPTPLTQYVVVQAQKWRKRENNVASDRRQSLVPGTLVKWDNAKAYGVITVNNGQVVQVHWDDAGNPPQFSASNPPLTRVDFSGRPVQRKSTGQNVAILSPVQAAAMPTWRCQIFSAAGTSSIANVPEADLRPLPITDPLERFRLREIGNTKRYQLRQVAQQYRTLNLQDDLVSLGQSQVDIQPHQVSVVHKVISNYPHRFLLCDEVGPGKTIEAGMVLKELRARGGAQRVLAIVPPNLVRQWQFEMR